MKRGQNKEYRVSFVPEDCTTLAQYWVTTRATRTKEDEPSPAWLVLYDYLCRHETFPQIKRQNFPDGCWRMILIVRMDERFEHTLRQYVSWLNQKYKERKIPLIVEKLPPDEPPAWGFSLAPPLFSQE